MSILFGGGTKVNQPKPETTLRINTAVYGLVRPFGAGQRRLPWNLAWYGDFASQAHQQSGGKGGVLGGGGKGGGKGGGVSYTYSAAVIGGICEGPVQQLGPTCWDSDGSQFQLSSKNLTAFLGTYSQSAWSYLTSKHPSQADTYRGLCYAAAGPMQLGASPALPNITFEIIFAINGAAPGWVDAHPYDHLIDYLTNPYYGLGFPSARIGDMTQWFNYCKAAGIFISPAYQSPQAASQHIQDLMDMTNSELVWNGGKLTVVPYGDQTITGNGVTYTPPSQALYSLGDDDLMPNQGASTSSASSAQNADPVVVTIKPNSQSYNIIKVQFNERTNNYNPQVVDAKDDGDIAMTEERPADLKTFDSICVRSVAMTVAHNLLARQAYRNEPVITVGPEYMLLDPMDLIEATNEALAMDNQWLRIKEITRNADKSLIFQCEEYLYGTGSTPVYGSEAGSGYVANNSVDPGDTSAPVLINPPSLLTQGALEAWIAVSGVDSNWGGCEVHVSLDGSSYSKVGLINGAARYGVLLANLASGSDPDTTHSFDVDLSTSLGQISGGSQQDVDAFATLAMIDNELIAYRDVTMVSTYEFTGSYLRRGAYGTTIAAHSTGASFVRLDDRIFKLPYTTAQKGTTIYVKLPSFNIYGGGLQDLSAVTAYSITLNSDGKFYYAQPIPDGNELFSQITAGTWTYTVPDGTPFVEIQIWGAGGAGGNSSGTSKGGVNPGYGGGGGAYVAHKIAVTAGTVLTGTVGTGGKNTANGTATTCTSPSLSAAYGTAAVSNTSQGVGGTASGGNVTNTNGHNGGLTNVWDGGSAGNGGGDQTANANPGTRPGGGGSGGYYGSPGAGADGMVRIVARSS